jgi:hypothetical protein
MSEYDRLKALAKTINSKQFDISHCQNLELLTKILTNANDVNKFKASPHSLSFPNCPESFLAKIHIARQYISHLNSCNSDYIREILIAVFLVDQMIEDEHYSAYLQFMPSKYLAYEQHPHAGLSVWLQMEFQNKNRGTLEQFHYETALAAGISVKDAVLIRDKITHIIFSLVTIETLIIYGVGHPRLLDFYRTLSSENDDWRTEYSILPSHY